LELENELQHPSPSDLLSKLIHHHTSSRSVSERLDFLSQLACIDGALLISLDRYTR